MLIQIDTGYACAGIIIDKQGIATDVAPIFSWMKGKSINEIKKWKRINRIEAIFAGVAQTVEQGIWKR